MNRETLIAIFLGFTGGILVAFLLVTVPKKLPKFSKETPSPSPKQEQSNEQPEIKVALELTNPENGIVVAGTEIEVSGTTKANTQVVLSGPGEDAVITSDRDGKFSGNLSIYEGENLLSATAYPENEDTVSESRTIFATYD